MSMEPPPEIASRAYLTALHPERAKAIRQLTEAEADAIFYDWSYWARPAQLEPAGDWLIWLILSGRGWGKTRVGSETIRRWACGSTPLTGGRFRRLALVAETAADARDVMVEGDSGILPVHPADFRPDYEPSKRRLTWPNGAVALTYNATEPDQLRGPQHDAGWCDELAKWDKPRDTWDMLQFGLRLGDRPLQLITTTPRPINLLKDIMSQPTTFLTRGTTSENWINLPASFRETVVRRYEGTRLGRQELNAEILDDNPDALWRRSDIDALRVEKPPESGFRRTVVAIDPSGASGAEDEKASEIGIVVAALGADGHGYVLADKTARLSPAAWGGIAVGAYQDFKADRIIAERNFGGAMVRHVIRTCDDKVAYKEVVASRGKWIRAEPVAALYEQKRVHHVGSLTKLEDEMCALTPEGLAHGQSPNRLDAMVWAITELMLVPKAPQIQIGRY